MPHSRLRAKRLADGRAMLNLGCGTRTHWEWNNLDFSPYAYLRRRRLTLAILRLTGIISAQRLQRLGEVDPDIILWDLSKGIPFDDGTFDAVYHSHLLEHVDLREVPAFLREGHRVLKPGGTIRVVVPDLEVIVGKYQSAMNRLQAGDEGARGLYEEATYELLWQMTNTEVVGTSEQKPWVRLVERLVRGDAARVGQLHRWMYDRYSLRQLLLEAGFGEVTTVDACRSRIQDWDAFRLDRNPDGSDYKPGSLYLEAVRADNLGRQS